MTNAPKVKDKPTLQSKPLSFKLKGTLLEKSAFHRNDHFKP
ncbi:hypothetical protein [Helicobacter pylori]|uniref:Uncharacterized protein n=1 Tax=Helicobacter pylori TaxID=210 RepID=A0A6F8EHX6_HELPX|nr:hypothetical protein [Helicobacter pylori]ASR82487.1 hypothetical protein [Helicobacter pylori]